MINQKSLPGELHNNEGTLLLIDKPADYSSARIVNIVKKSMNVKKAGHSGTLDPKATGLMIVCTEKKTKILKEILDYDKEYEGIMIIGSRTQSYDSETEPFDFTPTDNISDEEIHKTAESFIGEIEQIPPMYSAVKFKGKPLYKYARKGLELNRKKRKVSVKEFGVIDIKKPEIRFRIVCSKGTYIRSIVNDFGIRLGTGAYLKELRRTRIGEFRVENSFTVDEFIKHYRSIKGSEL
ncbi:MAG: tRNA pseudouridine(55) synthase TruB [Ignavibacteria bacterium]|nr:tRNA pseudouridine(55) synthase TruB [Ignavibacteria bacterium]